MLSDIILHVDKDALAVELQSNLNFLKDNRESIIRFIKCIPNEARALELLLELEKFIYEPEHKKKFLFLSLMDESKTAKNLLMNIFKEIDPELKEYHGHTTKTLICIMQNKNSILSDIIFEYRLEG